MSLFDKPRVFTIPAALPFLATLSRALLEGRLPSPHGAPPGPLELAGMTLLLPTRRATRALQDAFLSAGAPYRGGSRSCTGAARTSATVPPAALLLPRIRPIAEGEEDLTLLAGLAGLGSQAAAELDIPPAVSELERRLVLTKLVLQWSQTMRAAPAGSADGDLSPFVAAGANTPAQAANLARELARLIDMVETENVSLAGLDGLVAEAEFSEHWHQTLQFLNIVTSWWPAYLAASGTLSPMDRRNRLILAEARRIRETRPAGPMIVAGVTGSIPATVELIRAIAALPQGAIVLPGLDLDLDERSWQAITQGPGGRPHAEHPQFGLKTLLDRLGVARADVVALGEPAHISGLRSRLISEAMRPSATTAGWHTFTAAADAGAYARAVAGVTLIEAPSAQDEAETIALILREAAETPGRTAALVSPDRLLARRVAIRLMAWGIRVDDSAGRPFAKTVPGTVLDLTIDAIATEFAPVATVALLKHPLVRLGLDPFVIRRAARAVELAAFRAPYLGRGIAGIIAALDTAERDCAFGSDEPRGVRRAKAVRRLFPQDWHGARDLIDRLQAAVAPLVDLFDSTGPLPLASYAAAHAAAAEALCAQPSTSCDTPRGGITDPTPRYADGHVTPTPAPSALWQGEAGLAGKTLFEALMLQSMPAPAIAPKDYPDFYRALVATENVRPRSPLHPRLSIWGPFEARLQQPDIVILGSLNDGTWPEAADPGPWLNRPMRSQLKLPSPEEKIGYAAHDFTQAMAGPRVYLTRAEKIDGVPTVPSRWLMRLAALLGGMGIGDALKADAGGATYLAWARQRDQPAHRIHVRRPMPRPPVAIRPRQLSVSAVERWIANPYAIYAGRILGLEALAPIGTQPDASIRGGIIHEALARFTVAYPDQLPADIENELLRFAAGILIEWTGHPRVAAFWLPRFERFARWFADTEPGRRGGDAYRIAAEVKGKTVIGTLDMPFTLTARADRIDISGGALTLTDYKTGQPPSARKVLQHTAPQLPLEAAIALAGGFDGVPRLPVAGLRYIAASGGEPAGNEVYVATSYAAELAADAIAGLERHIATFDNAATPYAVTRRAEFRYDYDEFAHLARIAEWSAHASEED